MVKEQIDYYKGKRVLVTGHTGFKGSWLCKILKQIGAVVTGFSLEPPTNPSLFDLAKIENGMTSINGDVRDYEHLNKVFQQVKPQVVFHLAAQPIVLTSYKQPRETYNTNVMGTVNLLESCRLSSGIESVVVITTDKVYENKEWVWAYRENERLDGFDPYSNSKSCAELVVNCYVRSFFKDSNIAISTARAGNVIGGGDFATDRIIPDCVRAMQAKKDILVRNPLSTRPYQHVLEPLFAYMKIAYKQSDDWSLCGNYNIGPDISDCVTTGELVELFCKSWGDGTWSSGQSNVKTPHEANCLRLDCSLFKSKFGWEPRWHIQEAIAKTCEWSKAWLGNKDIDSIMTSQIAEFVGFNL